MFNVCPQCGQYSDEKVLDLRGPFAIRPFCGFAHPFCGFAHPFERLPLFIYKRP